MRAVRSSDTAPERLVRTTLHRLGYRFTLHSASMPGKPDIVFSRRRKVVFVHGCFWHGHTCRRGCRVPKTNRDYWQAKVRRNRARDEAVCREITTAGWTVLVLWECELHDGDALEARLVDFLGPCRSELPARS